MGGTPIGKGGRKSPEIGDGTPRNGGGTPKNEGGGDGGNPQVEDRTLQKRWGGGTLELGENP